MKKELYYQTVFKANQFKGGLRILFILLELAEHLIYPFTRKNLGERKFSFEMMLFASAFLAIVPVVFGPALQKLSYLQSGDFRDLREFNHFSYTKFILNNFTWYVFLGLVIYFGHQRYQEIKRLPSVFNFGRFTYSRGEIDSRFYEFKWNGKAVTTRMIDIIVEPGLFLLMGLALIILHQMVGYLIIIASVLCSLENKLAYVIADNFIMDEIDKMILSAEWENVIIEGKSPKDTRGVSFYGNLPTDKNMRTTFAKSFNDDDIITVS